MFVLLVLAPATLPVALGFVVGVLATVAFAIVFLGAVVLGVVAFGTATFKTGKVSTLASFGVGVVVHCQALFISAHASPSLALS